MVNDNVVRKFEEFQDKSSQDILKWALKEYHPKVALASSFGAEDIVIIDQLLKINSNARIFTLDTGRLHQETYDVMDAISEKYGIKIEVFYPRTEAVEKMVREYGMNLFYKSADLRTLCCKVRKVEPLNRAISSVDVWITGLRREQAPTRSSIAKVEIDQSHQDKIKINPIADWSSDKVWSYIKGHKLPYNKLHDKQFPSIGCAPCTRSVKPGEDPRTGRWWWEQASAKECGLHHTVISKENTGQ